MAWIQGRYVSQHVTRSAWSWPVSRPQKQRSVLQPTQITDADILNFALNLEYLEAEFYNCAVTGAGLPATLRGGGPASIGCQKANITGSVLVRAATPRRCRSVRQEMSPLLLCDNCWPLM